MPASSATTGWSSISAGTGTGIVVRFDYAGRIGFVRFVGTHTEYEAVDVSNI